MSRKYFLLDKNSLLKEVQAEKKAAFLHTLIEKVKTDYLRQCNPLGLVDDTVLSIQAYQSYDVKHLEEFYDLLSGIFRYQIGTNQLEFLFDGKTHYEKYLEDWESCFHNWMTKFCQQDRFLKAVLAVTVFYENEHSAILAENRLKYFISHYFGLKLYRYKGIMQMHVA
ncbi:hypothetical protein QQ020_30155 [Fulvivirgaceae bacterium BMA12]|uniref:Uncharacterized protein n=1 Tax=Agaribacillus aureus TaxID=3051825 RepID=A0ABT8LF09_9BACT|nr:hypothetical protein [Fulvivirgaceae bacterium BMA12]